jgi:hypothetical protein
MLERFPSDSLVLDVGYPTSCNSVLFLRQVPPFRTARQSGPKCEANQGDGQGDDTLYRVRSDT